MKTIKEIYCIICESKNYKEIFTKKGRHFYRCVNCNFEMQFPLPDIEDLKKYYNDSYRDGLYKEFVEASHMKMVNAKYRFNKVKSYLSSEKILDVGCSDGHFLKILENQGNEAEGIDISEVAVSQARLKGVKAYCAELDTFTSKLKYNTIIAFDIIEHLLNPLDFIDAIKTHLNKGGNLILSTPNKRSVFRRIMGKNWYFYIPEEHMHYFDNVTIQKILERNGFSIIKQSRFSKPLTLEYGLTQFKIYNPIIYKILKLVTSILPKKFNTIPIPFYIGEMLTVAKYTK